MNSVEERLNKIEKIMNALINKNGMNNFYLNADIGGIKQNAVINKNDITENSNGVLDIADLSDENSTALEDIAELLDDLETRVSVLEKKED